MILDCTLTDLIGNRGTFGHEFRRRLFEIGYILITRPKRLALQPE